ncbi:hypothetical protein FACS1894159_02470 [Bacteroidia bacterium]|nr:hypothetical protein FACS1894159_02470 [Bacteroidia bacterium]
MKKFVISLVGIALLASGCIDKPEITPPSPVAPGLSIYQGAALQNSVAMEPANVAFRLFILLREAQDQGIADLGQVMVTTSDEVERSLKAIFFGSDDISGSTVTETSPGKWTIHYPANDEYINAFDLSTKGGDVYIDTGGMMLDDPGAEWTITTAPDNASNKFFVIGGDYWNGLYRVYTSVSNYTITSYGDNDWAIAADDVAAYIDATVDQRNTSEWPFSFHLTADLAADPASTWGRMYGATYSLSGSAGGTSFIADARYYGYSYYVSASTPLLYRLSCGNGKLPRLCEGTLRCTLSDMEGVLGSSYPSMLVELTWSETEICKPLQRVDYNGHTETYQTKE